MQSFYSSNTLRSHENNGHIRHRPQMRHLRVVVVDGVEGSLVVQAEHEYHGIHPRCELHKSLHFQYYMYSFCITNFFLQNLSTSYQYHMSHIYPFCNKIIRAFLVGNFPPAHLMLRRTTFIPDKKQVTVPIYHDLLLEPSSFRTFFLHI